MEGLEELENDDDVARHHQDLVLDELLGDLLDVAKGALQVFDLVRVAENARGALVPVGPVGRIHVVVQFGVQIGDRHEEADAAHDGDAGERVRGEVQCVAGTGEIGEPAPVRAVHSRLMRLDELDALVEDHVKEHEAEDDL